MPVKLYDEYLGDLTRNPNSMVILSLDFCGQAFGVAPCTGTGDCCYNTYATCKSKANYTNVGKDYRFTNCDAPMPFKNGERPYIQKMAYLPTEIKSNLPVNARINIDFADEEDNDIGIDPYISVRGLGEGSYWKKLVARNKYLKNRRVRLFDGFKELPEGYWKQIWKGVVDNLTINRNGIRLEAVDLLKAIANIQVPAKSNIKLTADIDAIATNLAVSDVADLASTGYIRIGDEIIRYTGIADLVLTGCVRGEFATQADEHKAGNKVQVCKYYAPANPFEILKRMLIDEAGFSKTYTFILSNIVGAFGIGEIITGGTSGAIATITAIDGDILTAEMPEGATAGFALYETISHGADTATIAQITDYPEIDLPAFNNEKASPGGEIDFSACISEPTKLETLYFEIIDLLDCKSWVAESLQITIKRNLPNRVSESDLAEITDGENIIENSAQADFNIKATPPSYLTRFSVYWDKLAVGDMTKIEFFNRLTMAVDAESEGVNEYKEISDKTIYCRWIRYDSYGASAVYLSEAELDLFLNNLTIRRVWNYRDPMPILTCDLDLKDAGLKTGDDVRVSTDELTNIDGSDYIQKKFQIIRREKKGNRLTVKMQKWKDAKFLMIAPNTFPDAWADGTPAEKEYGGITDSDGKMLDGSDGAVIY